MQPTRDTERIVKEEIRKLGSDLEEIPDDHHAWLLPLSLPPKKAWRSRSFCVQLYEENGAERISVQRAMANGYIRPQNRDLRPLSWDELMSVKRAVGMAERWAVEIFPPDAEVVDGAPMRHLWLLAEAPPFAWRARS